MYETLISDETCPKQNGEGKMTIVDFEEVVLISNSRLLRAKPVSYTHLDVYKRQVS